METRKNIKKNANLQLVTPIFIGALAILVVFLFFAVANHSSIQVANAMPLPSPMPQETKQAEVFQKAGDSGDTSQIQLMIQTLQQKPQGYVADSAMHALALLGATEAVPVLDKYIHGDLSTAYGYGAPYMAADAQVAKARLLAEDTGKKVINPASRAESMYRKSAGD